MVFKNSKLYDALKWIFSVIFPASTTLYLALATIWHWPYAEAIGATLAAITAFGCTLLGISSVNYHKKLDKGE